MTKFIQLSLFDDVDGHSAITVSPLAKAGSGLIFSSIIPLHPTITSIWCPPDLTACADMSIVLLKNPGATGYKPVISKIISPVSSTFIAEAILYRDSCLASQKKMFQDDFHQLDFFTNLLSHDDQETIEENLNF